MQTHTYHDLPTVMRFIIIAWTHSQLSTFHNLSIRNRSVGKPLDETKRPTLQRRHYVRANKIMQATIQTKNELLTTTKQLYLYIVRHIRQ